MDPVSILIIVAVGGGCGILETNRLEGPDRRRDLALPFNIAIGALGGIGAGLFFSQWGQLYSGWLGPLSSGVIGAAFLLPITNWLISLATGKWAIGRLMPGKAASPSDNPPS